MTNPSVADFKAFFTRDFPYQPIPFPVPPGEAEPDKYVQDSDIEKAMLEAEMAINPALAPTQEQYNILFYYLTAHYLVGDLNASQDGLGGSFNWGETSRSVGSVSQGFQFPESVQKSPEYMFLSKTYYGAKYLSLILPLLKGNVQVIPGRTLP